MNFKKVLSGALGMILAGILVVGCIRPIGTPTVPTSAATFTPTTVPAGPCTNSFGFTCTYTPNLTVSPTQTATRTPTATVTLSDTPTPTLTTTSTPTPVSSFTPITTPTFVIPSSGIFVGAYMYADAISGSVNIMLAVNGAAENDPVTFETIGSTTNLTGDGTASYTGGTVETYYYAPVSCLPGASYIIGVQTSAGTANVTLAGPGNPVYTSTNTFTWSPNGNASYATAVEEGGSGSLYQSKNTTDNIISPYTFPPGAFPASGYSYELSVTAVNETTQIAGASPQSYFLITSMAATLVGE